VQEWRCEPPNQQATRFVFGKTFHYTDEGRLLARLCRRMATRWGASENLPVVASTRACLADASAIMQWFITRSHILVSLLAHDIGTGEA